MTRRSRLVPVRGKRLAAGVYAETRPVFLDSHWLYWQASCQLTLHLTVNNLPERWNREVQYAENLQV